MSDDLDKPESESGESKLPKIKAEDNPWFLLATLYGVPENLQVELKDKNRVAWNRYFAANLVDEIRARLIEEKRHPAEELRSFSPEELQDVATAFAKRCKASAKKLALPASDVDIDFRYVKFEQNAFFEEHLFSRDSSFQGTTFSGEAFFNGASFSVGADFVGARFSGPAVFRGARFSGGAKFDGASFSGGAKFNGASFSGGADFDSATFSGEAYFKGATFPGRASIDGATFPGQAEFVGATFSGWAFFGDASFSGPAVFRGTTFCDEAYFEGATFSGPADFVGASFSVVGAFFGHASFSGPAVFRGARFSGGAKFNGASFSVGAFFGDASFSGVATFNGATFSGEAYFKGATFLGWASFRGATVSGQAEFGGAIFSGGADFDGAAFSGGADFGGATFFGKAGFEGATFSGHTDFGEATFGGKSSFVNAEMKGETSFEGAIFETEPPKFFDAKLHQGTVWRGINSWPLPKDKKEAGAFIDAYACLKLEMDQLKKHEDELDFFALEMQSRRAALGPWRGFPITLYGLVSGYGRSYTLPLYALFMVVAIGALVLLLSGAVTPRQSPGISIANTLNVFGFRKDFFDAATIEHLPALLKILAALQTIFGTILLFLFGLGIRNRFRMK